ncbi:glycosyltransferase family 4 protein [Rudanella lutea]|uniref:glycosyltransferase family 4 protein n=1 Tax=Rudanella lutea TaxID=451374 RepID=UPI00037F7821|nr:glycosyltransferase family 1 protein [Rudanella lutea]
MNVFIDASPLGIGFYHPEAKTGVSRVVEELVRGLWQSKEIHLSLAAPSYVSETQRYAHYTFGRSGPRLVNDSADRRWAALENSLLRSLPPGSKPSKAIRAGLGQFRQTLRIKPGPLPVGKWAPGTIYHSPFFPIPQEVAQARHIRKVVTIHDLIPIQRPEWFRDGEQTVRQVIASLTPDTHVVCVSEATRTDFLNHTGFDPRQVSTIPLAASRELFYPVTDPDRILAVQERFGIGGGSYILSLATFEPRKNIDHLIRSFARLVETRSIPDDFNLVLVGTKGWKFDQIMAEINRTDHLQSRIILTGFVPDEDLAPLYSGALAFVYPSLYEGFGLPPLEAMQCGLPVITSDQSSLPEVVGDAALLVPPTNSDALCQALQTLINSSVVRAELAQKALERAALFSWDRFIREHIELYRTISDNR